MLASVSFGRLTSVEQNKCKTSIYTNLFAVLKMSV